MNFNEEIIHRYIDGELKKHEEQDFFNMLAESTEARNMFNELLLLNKQINNEYEEVSFEFEQQLFDKINNREELAPPHKNRFIVLAKYAAVILFAVFTTFLYVQGNEYEYRYKETLTRYNEQNRLMKVLYQSIPAVQVSGYKMNDIIVKTEM